jgi:hypothetical protein
LEIDYSAFRHVRPVKTGEEGFCLGISTMLFPTEPAWVELRLTAS